MFIKGVTLLCFFLISFPSMALVIDHTSIDAVADLPQATMEAVGTQSWYFMHASVGANMVDGLDALAELDPGRYLLATSAIHDDPPPSVPEFGVVYENYRGNPPWQEKVSMFAEAVRDFGWQYPNVNVVANKLCYDDWAADAGIYLTSMAELEAELPSTIFIYTTMPISIGDSSRNVARALFNEDVRAFCGGTDRVLFDIADIESHDPDGNEITFVYDGHVYPQLYSGYTSDGGHLNQVGAIRVATGWYATAAAILSSPTAIEVTPTMWGGIENVLPNPFNPMTTVRIYLSESRMVDVSIFDARGRFVSRLYEGLLPSGYHNLIWRGVDESGSAVGSGIYLVRLDGGGRVSYRRMALVR